MVMKTIQLWMRKLARTAKALAADRRGNIALISVLTMFPLLFATGMSVDFTLAQRRQDQINGYADAAALGAVTPAMMLQTSSASQTVAQNMFNGQLAGMTNITYSPADVTVTATDTGTGTAITRTVTVTYKASSQNIFSSVFGMGVLPISGTSTSTSSVSPNIDFYMLLDTSPSMEIAATTSGINTMVANTAPQGGCAFGCHETHPSSDNLGNPSNIICAGQVTASFPTGGEDNFALARCLGVPLRIDLVNQATQNLMSFAQATEAQNGATYRAAISTMDFSVNTLQVLTSDLAAASTQAGNLNAVTVYNNNCLTSSNCNSDEDSYLDTSLSNLNTAMPDPGKGTKNAGDTPQEVLFIVSDGVNDENSGGRKYPPISTASGQDWCTSIKTRGIRIAFLYTTYNPLPTNGWYNTYIAPEQSQIAPAAQACASPGLYFQVSTDGDISAAMKTLFQKAVATARLTQ
jgi:Flp pilus assembly protein TadG